MLGVTQVQRFNWLQFCRNPIVDAVVLEPCETLTTPDGYTLTSEGQRVAVCVLGGGLLLYADPTGRALAEVNSLASQANICGSVAAPLVQGSNSPASSSSNPLGNLLSGLLGHQ